MDETLAGIAAADLIAPPSVIPLPAPVWLMLVLKVLGFTLHVVPMSLWFAGLPVALLMASRADEHSRRTGLRLLRQLPIILAIGINIGIVPLLFLQVLFHRTFYPATILFAWPWLMMMGALVVAYYLIYYVAANSRRESLTLAPHVKAAGWLAVGLFISIGVMFTTGMQNMTLVEDWPAMFARHDVGGAVSGWATNHGNPVIFSRVAMVFGLALMTVAAWFVFDAGVLARGESEEWKRRVPQQAFRVFIVGAAVFGLMGALYLFATMPALGRARLLSGPMIVLTALTVMAPAATFGLIWSLRGQAPAKMGWFVLLAQVGVIGINAVSRQVAQIAELGPHVSLGDETVRVQASPLILFLLLFVGGLGLLTWMILRCVRDVTEVPARDQAS